MRDRSQAWLGFAPCEDDKKATRVFGGLKIEDAGGSDGPGFGSARPSRGLGDSAGSKAATKIADDENRHGEAHATDGSQWFVDEKLH
jgi:hypothetical protein